MTDINFDIRDEAVKAYNLLTPIQRKELENSLITIWDLTGSLMDNSKEVAELPITIRLEKEPAFIWGHAFFHRLIDNNRVVVIAGLSLVGEKEYWKVVESVKSGKYKGWFPKNT